MSENSNLIYKKIPEVMKKIEAIGKDRSSTQFKFRGIDDVYNDLHTKLADSGLFTTTEVLEHIREEKTSKSGGVINYSIMKIRFKIFAEDGSFVENVMIGEAMDSGDKSSNKSMSVAHKYLFLQVFSIPTEDDKDPDYVIHQVEKKTVTQPNDGTHKQKFGEAEKAAANKAISESLKSSASKAVQEPIGSMPPGVWAQPYVATIGKHKGKVLTTLSKEELRLHQSEILNWMKANPNLSGGNKKLAEELMLEIDKVL